MATVATKVNVHLSDNVPYRQHDQEMVVDIDLELVGTPGFLGVRKESARLASVYELRVIDLAPLGIGPEPSDEQVARALLDLVLAMNLVVPRGVFTQSDVSPHGFTVARDDEPSSSVVERDAAGNVTVRVAERIRLTDYAKVTLSTKVTLDQGRVVHAVRLVRRARSVLPQGSDMLRALAAFGEGCRALDRVAMVRHHAAAIELAANAGRTPHLDGAALDAEVARLSGFAPSTAQRIRLFSNRIKHADRGPQDQALYEATLPDVGRLAGEAKLIAAAALLARLGAD